MPEAQRSEGGRRILWVNEALERLTGYEGHELVGMTPRVLRGPWTSGEVTRRLAEAIDAYQPVEAEPIN